MNHVELVRKAREAEMPESFWEDPLMYQGASDNSPGPMQDIVVAHEAWSIDIEAERAAITDDVPMGATPDQAQQHISSCSSTTYRCATWSRRNWPRLRSPAIETGAELFVRMRRVVTRALPNRAAWR